MKQFNINGVEVFAEEAERYVQINDASEAVLRSAWDEIISRFAGFEIALCYHNNEPPAGFLTEIGAEPLDDCIEMRLPRDGFNSLRPAGVFILGEEDFNEFAALHDERNPDMYWTGARIKSDLTRWRIFITRGGGKINGYAMTMVRLRDERQAEIFCAEADYADEIKSLLVAAASDVFENGKDEIIYMPDAGTPQHDAALSVGFVETGYYKGYKAKLKK